MAKINILPSKVYNRIAAGEVVDRPYSVVKELVENSIDAGATEIEIHVDKGGKELIRVIDNGCGIEMEDLHSAFLPHATSKIEKAEDLDTIMTLGFRGEAVASIASISKMSITSKTENGKCYQLSCNGGDIGRITEATGEKGTDVCVSMLFYNTPVRLTFLKSDKAAETEITNFVSRFILNHSNIAFTYYVNGKKVLQSFGGGDEEAMVCVYGAAVLSECFCIDAQKHGIRIRGYIGDQNFFKANKSYQNVFLNGRYIINSTISAAISNAYASYLMKRQYPFYVLHIDVPTEIVDVNVHPNKSDVRFADNQIIYGCIYSVISSVLDGQTKALDYVVKTPSHNPAYDEMASMPTMELPKTSQSAQQGVQRTEGFATLTYEEAKREIEENTPLRAERKTAIELPFDEEESREKNTEERKKPAYPKGFIPKEMIGPYVPKPSLGPIEKSITPKDTGAEELHKRFPDLYLSECFLVVKDPQKEQMEAQGQTQAVEEDAFAANKRYLEEQEKKKKQNRIDVSNCVYAGKLFNTYLIYELGDSAYIIDQHAAHERLIYNRLKAQMDARAIVRQPMLLPFELKVNPIEGMFLEGHLAEIRDLGFEIVEMEENTFSITEIPTDLQNINLTAFFNDILGDIDGYKSIKLADILKDKLASAACKAAVKGGMELTREEIDALFALMDGDMGLKCPHGRPVVVKLTKTELEKMFKRIV